MTNLTDKTFPDNIVVSETYICILQNLILELVKEVSINDIETAKSYAKIFKEFTEKYTNQKVSV